MYLSYVADIMKRHQLVSRCSYPVLTKVHVHDYILTWYVWYIERCIALGLMPLCENMPGGKATKPGDVHVSMSGKTVQVHITF